MPLLTDILVKDAEPRDRDFFIWDNEVRGFGVKLSRSGRKSFVLQWRTEDPSKTHRRKLADVDEINVASARALASRLKIELTGPADQHGDQDAAGSDQHAVSSQIPARAPADSDYSEQDLSKWLDGSLEFSGKGLRSRAAATRIQILDAACQAFLEHGYEANVDQIALAAGVAKPTIYKYFKDKPALFRQTVTELVRRATPDFTVPEGGGVRETLHAVATTFVQVLTGEPTLSLFRLAVGDMRSFPELTNEAHRAIAVRLTRLLADYIRGLIAEGQVRPVDADIIAEAFLAGSVGFGRSRRLLGINTRTADQDRGYAEAVTDFFVVSLTR